MSNAKVFPWDVCAACAWKWKGKMICHEVFGNQEL